MNKQAIPKLQAQLTGYQTLKQELHTQISKSQELLKDQEKPDLDSLAQAVEASQESYDRQLAQVSVMEQGLKDATVTYQAAKTLQLVVLILRSTLSVSISNKFWTMPMPTTSVS